MLRNKFKFLIICIALALLLCPLNASFAQKADTANQKQQKKTETLLPTKQENKNIFGKFLITMLWVLGSAGVIYILLLAYKKHKDDAQNANEESQDLSMNLSSPQNVEDAIDFVIKKF